jgi:hypothetical protein
MHDFEQLDALEQAERLLDQANDALNELLAVGPPPSDDPADLDTW